MSWKSNLVAGLLIGGTAFTLSAVAWNGEVSLDNIKGMYNELFSNYEISLGNVSKYKKVLIDKQKELDDLDTVRTNLIADNEAKAQQIADLQAQIKQLETDAEENNANNSEQIATLQAQLDELQAEYDNVEADLNELATDYNRVVAELEQANAQVLALEQEIQTKHESITPTTELTEEDIINEVGGEVVQKLYMYFGLGANSGQTGSVGIEQGKQVTVGNEQAVISALDAIELLDNYRESPVLLHFISNTSVYMSSQTAFNTMYENATEVYDNNDTTVAEEGKLYKISGDTSKVVIKVNGTRVTIRLADENRWCNVLGYEAMDN